MIRAYRSADLHALCEICLDPGIHQPARVDPILAVDYPAHMHADLLPRAQGKGFGGTLVRAVLERLEKGVHIHVRRHNTHAIGFWQHLGFRQIDAEEKLVLGLRL